ncbi:DUF6691 family protein [Arenicella xantha]|uniref:Sulphur transport domain-containing protein n=1 Tax=Arenicella xantha TaxID=644221 RepID=A0A395JJ28_9GAMM|nr:DUF6691 family protein [Arenicella xantha]RBP50691.1 hypothetical protein DFR28_102102 [Arenicella xantha]
MRLITIFISGLVFGIGIIVSGMVNPAKVIGFLDIFGAWDPSLAFVMIGAISVTMVGYKLVLKRDVSLFNLKFSLPTNTDLDRKLIIGAVLFGIGWGLVGVCPGPAVVGFLVAPKPLGLFLVSMLVSMALARRYMDRVR